jgi:hypothetical protein
VILCQVVPFDGFDPPVDMAPYEVLSAGPSSAPGALGVELVTAEGSGEVPAGMGFAALWATAALDPYRADLVLVRGPAGSDNSAHR